MCPILGSFEEKMMHSIKSMHYNADCWDVTSGVVGILAKFIKFIFCVFPLSYICVMAPHSRYTESTCRQLLTCWCSEEVTLGFGPQWIHASGTVHVLPSVCGAAADVCGNFTRAERSWYGVPERLQWSGLQSVTWELAVSHVWNALLQTLLHLLWRTETRRCVDLIVK